MCVAGPGEVAGEMACINLYPHTESACAGGLRDPGSGAWPWTISRSAASARRSRRSTASTSCPTPSDAATFWHRCASRPISARPSSPTWSRRAVEVVRHGPDEAIFTRGSRADGLFSIHIGHVRVSAHRPGGEATVAYAGPLEFFGEVALLSDLLDVRTGDLPMSRVFTCRGARPRRTSRIGPASLPLLPSAVRHALVTSGLDRLRRA